MHECKNEIERLVSELETLEIFVTIISKLSQQKMLLKSL